MGHRSQTELDMLLTEATKKITVGATYTHYQHPEQPYTVLYVGLLEASEEPCVIYQSSPSSIVWVRPLTNWLAEVEHEGVKVPRFRLLS